MDPITRLPKSLAAAVIDVIEEDGKTVSKRFSTISEKLAKTLLALHLNGSLYSGKIGITQRGEGYIREFSVRTI